jgi:hypothetical protein
MAAAQVKPTSGGSWANAAGKTGTNVATLKPYQQQAVLTAAAIFQFSAGTGAHAQRAQKTAAAVGMSLQWA